MGTSVGGCCFVIESMTLLPNRPPAQEPLVPLVLLDSMVFGVHNDVVSTYEIPFKWIGIAVFPGSEGMRSNKSKCRYRTNTDRRWCAHWTTRDDRTYMRECQCLTNRKTHVSCTAKRSKRRSRIYWKEKKNGVATWTPTTHDAWWTRLKIQQTWLRHMVYPNSKCLFFFSFILSAFAFQTWQLWNWIDERRVQL